MQDLASFECLRCKRTLPYQAMSSEVELCGVCFDKDLDDQRRQAEQRRQLEQQELDTALQRQEIMEDLWQMQFRGTIPSSKGQAMIEIQGQLLHIDNMMQVKKTAQKDWLAEDKEDREKLIYRLEITLRTGSTESIPCADEASMTQAYQKLVAHLEEAGLLFKLDVSAPVAPQTAEGGVAGEAEREPLT